MHGINCREILMCDSSLGRRSFLALAIGLTELAAYMKPTEALNGPALSR